MIRKTLMISAALLALAGCDNSPINLGQGGESAAASSVAEQFREALAQAPKHGLTVDMFLKGDVEAAGEAQLRQAVAGLASALAMGKSDPAKLREVYTLPRPKVDVQAGFEQAVAENRVVEWLNSLAPQTDEYRKLSQAFVHYVDLAAKTPDTNIPQGEPMEPGANDPRVPAVVEALKAGGYMTAQPKQGDAQQPTENASASAPAATEYTAEVAEGVKRMQQDFGLEPDGVIGTDTLKAVNTSAKDRARQLAVALERLRWLDRQAPATRIDVNTAAAFLNYWRDGQLVDERRVVVGQPDWETPPLGSPIFQLVANPTWTVPESIEKDELAGKGAAYFRANNMVRKNGRIVQQPGPKNSLGQVKFDMKNTEAIYLHDTPHKQIFAQNERHRSHGCVRVHNAIQFAQLLAQSNGVLDEFNKALASGDETFVDLKTEIPVRLLYHTAYVGTDGKIHFSQDAYGWDNDVAAALGYARKQAPRRGHDSADVGP
ncbi:MAG TPA: L,D-transpeptidase family protein [Sphingomicrobium sp.]|nr:L,D-transpeptidase family protein [Sphingomicrobium sp.]